MNKQHPQNNYSKRNKTNQTIICLPYDIDNIYAFYCSRYKDIPYNEFLDLGMTEFNRKLSSIPETEPLYKIIQSRTINIAKIKDKEQKKYWREMKRINAIPDIYKSTKELDEELKQSLNKSKFIGGNK